MGLSNERKDKILDAVFGGTAYHEEGERWLGLATVPITGADDGTTVVEPSWTGYARILTSSADWDASSGGVKKSIAEKVFAECTAGEDTHVAFFVSDHAETGKGTIVGSGVVPPTLISKGIKPKFTAGGLSFSMADAS